MLVVLGAALAVVWTAFSAEQAANERLAARFLALHVEMDRDLFLADAKAKHAAEWTSKAKAGAIKAIAGQTHFTGGLLIFSPLPDVAMTAALTDGEILARLVKERDLIGKLGDAHQEILALNTVMAASRDFGAMYPRTPAHEFMLNSSRFYEAIEPSAKEVVSRVEPLMDTVQRLKEDADWWATSWRFVTWVSAVLGLGAAALGLIPSLLKLSKEM